MMGDGLRRCRRCHFHARKKISLILFHLSFHTSCRLALSPPSPFMTRCCQAAQVSSPSSADIHGTFLRCPSRSFSRYDGFARMLAHDAPLMTPAGHSLTAAAAAAVRCTFPLPDLFHAAAGCAPRFSLQYSFPSFRPAARLLPSLMPPKRGGVISSSCME